MREEKPMPRCPYCGAEMSLEDNEDVLFGLFSDEEKMYWYQSMQYSVLRHPQPCESYESRCLQSRNGALERGKQ